MEFCTVSARPAHCQCTPRALSVQASISANFGPPKKLPGWNSQNVNGVQVGVEVAAVYDDRRARPCDSAQPYPPIRLYRTTGASADHLYL